MKRRLSDFGPSYQSLPSAFLISTCTETTRPVQIRALFQNKQEKERESVYHDFSSLENGSINVHPKSGIVSINGLIKDSLQQQIDSTTYSTTSLSSLNPEDASVIEVQFSQKDQETNRLSSTLSWSIFRHIKELDIERKEKNRRDSRLGQRRTVVKNTGERRIAAEAQEIGRSSARPLITPEMATEIEMKKKIKESADTNLFEERHGIGLLDVELEKR
jgi:hypothetical protein